MNVFGSVVLAAMLSAAALPSRAHNANSDHDTSPLLSLTAEPAPERTNSRSDGSWLESTVPARIEADAGPINSGLR